jgi:membrane protein DedA with SNARE-associated domain
MDRAALWYYVAAFGALLAAGLGFPIPEELPIVTAGALVGHASEEPTAPPEFVIEVPPEFVQKHIPGFVANLAAAPQAGFPGDLPLATLSLSSRASTAQKTELEDIREAELEKFRVSRLPRLFWWIMLPVCILGVVISDGFLYCVGRFGGRRLLNHRWARRMLSPKKLVRVEENFHKYGITVLLFARFLPAIRSPIFITAGIMRLPFYKFVLADGLYAIPGVSLLFYLSFTFGDRFRDLVERAVGRVDKLKPLLILLVLTAIGTYLVYHFLRHPVATGDPREEVPLVGEKIASKIEHTGSHVVPRPDHQPPATTGAEAVRPPERSATPPA